MKFQSRDEMDRFSFDNSEVLGLAVEGGNILFTFGGAVVKADNSNNSRFQDMYCGEICLELEHAKIARFVKEGLKYYDADGNLQKEIPNEDVPVLERGSILERLSGGTVFTVVKDEVSSGYAYEFGIDVPAEEDEEDIETYWLCILFEHMSAGWERYCGPVEE